MWECWSRTTRSDFAIVFGASLVFFAPALARAELYRSLGLNSGSGGIGGSNTVDAYIQDVASNPFESGLIHGQYGALRVAATAYAPLPPTLFQRGAYSNVQWHDTFQLTWIGAGPQPSTVTVRFLVRLNGVGTAEFGDIYCNLQSDWIVRMVENGNFVGPHRTGEWKSCSGYNGDSLDQGYAFDIPMAFGLAKNIGGYLNGRAFASNNNALPASGNPRSSMEVTAEWQGIQVLDNLGSTLTPGVHYTLSTGSGTQFGVDWLSPISLSPPIAPACGDGIDNDADGFLDFPGDPECTSATAPSEVPEPSVAVGLGIGIAMLGVFGLRQPRMRRSKARNSSRLRL